MGMLSASFQGTISVLLKTTWASGTVDSCSLDAGATGEQKSKSDRIVAQKKDT